jgi:hypothetical protein
MSDSPHHATPNRGSTTGVTVDDVLDLVVEEQSTRSRQQQVLADIASIRVES